MDVKIVELAPMQLVCMRNTGSYANLPMLWGQFGPLLNRHRLWKPGVMCMILFHDHDESIPIEQRRSDVCVTALGEVEISGEMFIGDFPGGTYAVAAHLGPYEEIGPAWARWRREWLPTSGWKLSADRPAAEWYQNDPSRMPRDLLVTLLCDPVERVSPDEGVPTP